MRRETFPGNVDGRRSQFAKGQAAAVAEQSDDDIRRNGDKLRPDVQVGNSLIPFCF